MSEKESLQENQLVTCDDICLHSIRTPYHDRHICELNISGYPLIGDKCPALLPNHHKMQEKESHEETNNI